MTRHEYPITLEVPGAGTLENVPAEWIDPEDGGPLALERVWIGHLPVKREDVAFVVGIKELHRQERLADQHHAETAGERSREAAQAWVDFRGAAE